MLEIKEPSTPVLIQDLGVILTKSGKEKRRHGIYRCSCGNEFKIVSVDIKNGHTKSCGCYRKKVTSNRSITHNLSGNNPLYKKWAHMISRCSNIKSKDYSYYGARGIIICIEWRNNFKLFYDWAMDNGYVKGLEIDRIDVNGNYEPSNCRFVSRSMQMINTSLIHSNNTSGYRGVSFNKKENMFYANITMDKKLIFSKRFKTIDEAVIARNNFISENNLPHEQN